jgi:hypothetical protein
VLCMAAAEGHMPTIDCLLQHCLLDTASGADHVARSAAWLSAAVHPVLCDLDASTKPSVVQRLLLPAMRSNASAVKAALQESMEPASKVLCNALIDAWLDSDAVDLNKQHAAVQHLIVGMAAAHKQERRALERARLALRATACIFKIHGGHCIGSVHCDLAVIRRICTSSRMVGVAAAC